MPRKIKAGLIEFVSLCPSGKTGLRAIYKAEDDSFVFEGMGKMDEQGALLTCVYAPNRMDSDEEWAPKEIVRQMAYDHARRGLKLDVMHDEVRLSRDQAFVAEHFIIQKGDTRFDGITDREGKPVDCEGGWGQVIQLDDPDLRKLYREEGWRGVSIGGHAILETAEIGKADSKMGVRTLIFKKTKFPMKSDARRWAKTHGYTAPKVEETDESWRIRQADGLSMRKPFRTKLMTTGVSALMGRRPGSTTEKADKMANPITDETLASALAPHLKTFGESLMEGLKKLLPAPVVPPMTEVVLKFDSSDPKSVDAVRAQLRKAEAVKVLETLDINDPKALEARAAELKKASGTPEERKAAESKEQNERIAKMEQELVAMRKASGQPDGSSEAPTGRGAEVSLGSSIAAFANRGRVPALNGSAK